MTDFLNKILAHILVYILADIPANILAYILVDILIEMLADNTAYIHNNIITDILADIPAKNVSAGIWTLPRVCLTVSSRHVVSPTIKTAARVGHS